MATSMPFFSASLAAIGSKGEESPGPHSFGIKALKSAHLIVSIFSALGLVLGSDV